MITKYKLIIYFEDGKMKEIFNLIDLFSIVSKSNSIERLIIIGLSDSADILFEKQFAVCG